jgi:hypothetical protein
MKQITFFLLASIIYATSISDTLAGSAYAPDDDQDNTPINLADEGEVSYPAFTASSVTVSGKTDLHITGETPLVNSTVNLTSDDSWLFFDAVKPSVVINLYLKTKSVTVNGDSVVLKLGGASDNSRQNARIAIYGVGSVIIPNGNATDATALEVFTEPGFEGSSKYYPVFTRHTSLGTTFNNAIRSFKLKRGYMATLANKTDGTGFSKVFIAANSDLEFSVMPKGLDASVSFIRVFRWDWNGQRGWAGGGTAVSLTNSTSFYDWNSGGESTNPDFNYALIKQKLHWPGNDIFNTKANVNHLLGYNEPDHGEQHEDDNGGNPITVETAVGQWPQMMASGLRLGTPAPTNFTWLYEFLAECDKLNYRVDFVAIHSYWYTSMSSWRSQLRAVWNNGKRPIWITEWNNGANWTSHSFPEANGPRCDADGNIVLKNGAEETITLPCSPANATKQLNDIKGIVGIMEEPENHIERYFIYNWVQDARAIELNGKLTPAGKWYAANPSKLAFTSEYDHKWKLVVPDMSYTQSSDYIRYTFNWKDYNGETAKGYILERNVNNSGWEQTGDTIPARKSDAGGIATLAIADTFPGRSTVYRYKVIGYDDSEAVSTAVSISANANAASPTVTGEALSATEIKLNWNTIFTARSYRIKRATLPDSVYTVVKNIHIDTSYDDKTGLLPNTIYYYTVHSLNNRGESAGAVPVKVITKKIDGTDGDGTGTGIQSRYVGENILLSPNPVKTNEPIAIHYEANGVAKKDIAIGIFDATGKQVSGQSADKTIYAPDRPGVYIVKIITPILIKTIKLIVT